MSKTSFDDFLKWKKEQHTTKKGRRYKEDSSSDDHSSIEEVKFSKRRVAKKYESDSESSDDYPKRPTRTKNISNTENRSNRNSRRYEEDEDDIVIVNKPRRRGGDERRRVEERRRGGDERRRGGDDERRRGGDDRRRKEQDVEEVRYRKENNGSRRQKKPQYKSNRRNLSESDESSSVETRYRRNEEDSDSDELSRRKTSKFPKTKTAPTRSKSEHSSRKKQITKKKVNQSSEEEIELPTKKKPLKKEDSSSEEENNRPIKKNSKNNSKPEIKTKPTRDSSSSSSSDEDVEREKVETEKKTNKPKINTKNSSNSNRKNEKKALSFNHAAWIDNYEKIKKNKELDSKQKRSTLKSLLETIEESTERICSGENYTFTSENSDSKEDVYSLQRNELMKNVKKTALYTFDKVSKHLPQEGSKGNTKTSAHFLKSDIIDVGLFIKKDVQKNPLVLMMGDSKNPGGKDRKCLFGEEIAIWRRTAIREFLDPHNRKKYYDGDDKFVYDIPEDGAIYCPNVPVFRGNPAKGYNLIAPETLSFLVVPPVMKPQLQNGSLSSQDRNLIEKKITLIFLVALALGHDAVVLTAFGCGYAENPPNEVAEIFGKVITKFRNHFSNIVFSIIDNENAFKNNKEGNVKHFKEIYEKLKKK